MTRKISLAYLTVPGMDPFGPSQDGIKGGL